MDGIKFPFGKPDVIDLTIDDGGEEVTATATISNTSTVVKATTMDDIAELNLVPHAELMEGAMVQLDITGGDEATGFDVAFGSSVVAPDLVGEPLDQDRIMLRYDKDEGKFVATTLWLKLVDDPAEEGEE